MFRNYDFKRLNISYDTNSKLMKNGG